MARVVFGPFRLDTRCLELWKDGRKLRLRPQPCRVLAVMVTRPGQLVTRDEIRRAVWPSDVFVRFDLGLNSCLKQIRRALGDTVRSPIYLETLNGRGYRFTGQVQVTPDHGVPSQHRLTIVPFSHAGDHSPPWADALTDDLARHLTREPASPVVVVDAAVPGCSDVDFLLRGRVRSDGHGLRVTASLLATHDLSHVWADVYDAPLSNALDAQEQMASAIAKAVTAACIAAPPRPSLVRPHLPNVPHDAHGHTLHRTAKPDRRVRAH